MSISLKQIRYFVAAAETGRISQAAVELNVSQSAVTAAIQQLEAMLGSRLLDRTPTGVSVTLEGSRFLLQGRQILTQVAEAVRDARHSTVPIAGTVRVGVTYTVSGYFLPRHHIRFQSSFPGITIELFEAPRSVVEQALVDGALDVAVLLVSNLKDDEHLASQLLLRSARRLWLAPSHPLTRPERVRLADIARYPYVMLTVDEAKHTALRYWTAQGLEPNAIFRTSSVEAVRSMVGGGMGVTVLSDLVYRPWSLEGQRIELRDVADEVPSMDVGLAWRRDAVLTPATQAFCDFLRFAVAGDSAGRAAPSSDPRGVAGNMAGGATGDLPGEMAPDIAGDIEN
ncbi:LysR family transcriptional regulator [Ancylobacter sp. Lp-2]|uniref:LysR family transcriptional regulator n=1 Tax=Ancylobacter sp. Lp-2 TaxID=2881339 RepID=UPI001E43A33C|nr:LysR family transcriptional regulator [Ancylobacter sp. Lp-2]MCB4769770.1 LysR family transcriptional regulator [Ancylobacter sp. Lp-2]